MDPLIGAALISGVASLGGGWMSAQGASAANAQNAMLNQQNLNFQNNVNAANWEHQQAVNQENKIMSLGMLRSNQEFAQHQGNTAMQFASDQAQLQRNWQERMSNSAYQRATADMRAAGINPMLAYMQGGASTPSGGQAAASPMGATGSASTSANAPGSGAENRFSMANTQEELGRAVGRIASSAIDSYKNSQAAELMDQQRQTEKEATTEMHNRAQVQGQEISNRATLGHVLQQDWKLKEEQIKSERNRQGQILADTVRATSAARYYNATSANEELRNREARPIDEGGYGRGTGVGPSFPERILRNLNDTITDVTR